MCADAARADRGRGGGGRDLLHDVQAPPDGDYHVGVCTNTLCAIMGGDAICERLTGAPRHRARRDHRGRHDHAWSSRVHRRLRLRAGVMVNWEFFDNQTPESATRAGRRACRPGEVHSDPRRPICTLKEAARVLRRVPDGLADEGRPAGRRPWPGSRSPREHGWTAPEPSPAPSSRLGRLGRRGCPMSTLTPVLSHDWDAARLLHPAPATSATAATQALRTALAMPAGPTSIAARQGLRAARPRRRGLPDRHEVVLHPAGRRQAALPGGQRRRVRAGHLQGHPADDRRPAPADRGRDHRVVRDPAPRTPSSTSAARSLHVVRRLQHAVARGLRRRLPGQGHPRARASTWSSWCTAAPAPTSAARRPRCWTRWRVAAASPGCGRRSRRWTVCTRRPTVINNVETHRHRAVDRRQRRGLVRARWAPRSRRASKLYSLSGHVARPGSTRRRWASRCASCSSWPAACRDGHELKFWTPGGSSTPLLTAEHLDVPLDFEAVGRGRLACSAPGAADLRRHRPASSTRVPRWIEFYTHESCGKCTPCREGTWWLVQILRPARGRARAPRRTWTRCWTSCDNILGRSFCALADGAIGRSPRRCSTSGTST